MTDMLGVYCCNQSKTAIPTSTRKFVHQGGKLLLHNNTAVVSLLHAHAEETKPVSSVVSHLQRLPLAPVTLRHAASRCEHGTQG